jgi:hypothetical protein
VPTTGTAATTGTFRNPPTKRASLTPEDLRASFKLTDHSIDELTKTVAEKCNVAKANASIKWNDIIESKRISRMTTSFVGRMFYSDTDIAEFRQEAFMEECGIDPNEFE